MDEGISYISERIQKVNEVVGKVEEIISVIEGISGQTNLLSLNASIEAARAGEAGRGFAVVAEEIRVLSDNTSSELNRIKSIIAELIRACEECVSASIREMAEKYPDIAGIGVTSFGETFVCVDETGEPLHPAMLYTDPRGKEECRELVEKLGEREIANITGLRPHEMYSISKIMWIKKNQPEVYSSARKIFLMEDYVVYHLTGNAQIDYSLATRTMAFDIRNLCWSREIFEAAGIDRT